MNRKTGKVFLVGAGPGDPSLLTLKAHKILKEAKIVLYDRLVGGKILDIVPSHAERISVGKKRDNTCVFQQEVINELMVQKATAGNDVVRLKGGDPYVFGKGSEEALALRTADIEYEVVPGITSAVSVPGSVGIPLTHRGLASAFAVFTAHLAHDPDGAQDGAEIDWELAARIPTAVFLMGVKRLPEIVQNLITAGRSPDTPIALIEKGTLPEQRVISGTLRDIIKRSQSIKPPATIVVGEVVRLKDVRDSVEFESIQTDFLDSYAYC